MTFTFYIYYTLGDYTLGTNVTFFQMILHSENTYSLCHSGTYGHGDGLKDHIQKLKKALKNFG